MSDKRAQAGGKHSRPEPRRQISNPVQRSATRINDQASKARPVNTSRKSFDPPKRSATTATQKSHARAEPARGPSVKGDGRGKPASKHPGLQRHNTSFQTQYMEMLLHLDTIPRLHNILASAFTWVLLAGFVLYPGTFKSIQSLSDDPNVKDSEAASTVLDRVKDIPLLVVASICCGAGAAGMIWLSVRWRRNYVWLLNRLYLPGVLNSLAGLISTLVNVYASQNGTWSITALVTGIVEACCMVVCGILFVVVNYLLLARVRRQHGREVEIMQQAETDDGEEGFFEKVGRKAKKPGLEPGSVV